ncbi:phosphoribosylamine--glycine ligase [Persicobacter psychrovividus]|uniref:Phosphoribosylamine--glycine ligase n=1 Tax=Persicobacter psychrovividus TaxID=387638 RepID=A0ABN6LA21_9BACT|nr:phosphoribosylamine--glycine ligase [Persicobacter psychrovividus]
MNILILGSGGREHAFTWKIKQSPKCDRLFVAPGNAGTAEIAENVNIGVTDFEALGAFILKENIDLMVVGPEVPLVEGVRDFFEADEKYSQLKIVGPKKDGATLEGSKDFSKAFMQEYGIPTAAYQTFTAETIEEGLTYLDGMNTPIVLKADGLAAGKGVLICETHEDAKASFKEMLLEAKFGAASASVVVEEFLTGIELSVFVLTDGKDYVILPEAKDYKRIGEQDTGLNTGGMGAVSPVSFAGDEFMKRVEDRVVKPTINGLQDRGIDYNGFIFIGLMNDNGDPKVIEYNVRMGDPETQVVIPRIKSDFLDLLEAAANGQLGNTSYEVYDEIATTVVMVAGGYPEAYGKGDEITGIADVNTATVFHAGTKAEAGKTLTNGGRVLNITGKGDSLNAALENAYAGVNKISWDKANFRKDIGQDLLKLEK